MLEDNASSKDLEESKIGGVNLDTDLGASDAGHVDIDTDLGAAGDGDVEIDTDLGASGDGDVDIDQQSDVNENCCNSPDDQFNANNNEQRNMLPNVSEMKKRVLEGQNLAFFHNGCFAPKEERFSQTGSNYTCAIDTLIALGEAILLSGNDKSVAHAMSFSPLLLEIKSVLVWRLENEFKWNHSLRNEVWKLLATHFPVAICPIGKVTAVIEPGVQELEKLWYAEVIVETVCREAGCGNYLGRFRVVSEQLVLSSPLKGELKNKEYTLSELFLNTFSNHVNNIIRHKVRCSRRGCGGLAKHTGIFPENLKIPPFLFLNFHLMGSPSYYHNDFKDSCVLKQDLQLGKTNLNLLCGRGEINNSYMRLVTTKEVFKLRMSFLLTTPKVEL